MKTVLIFLLVVGVLLAGTLSAVEEISISTLGQIDLLDEYDDLGGPSPCGGEGGPVGGGGGIPG